MDTTLPVRILTVVFEVHSSGHITATVDGLAMPAARAGAGLDPASIVGELGNASHWRVAPSQSAAGTAG